MYCQESKSISFYLAIEILRKFVSKYHAGISVVDVYVF